MTSLLNEEAATAWSSLSDLIKIYELNNFL